MSETLTNKIKDFFNSVNCKPDYILKGQDKEMYPLIYVVICSGNFTNENNYQKLDELEERENISIETFEQDYFPDMIDEVIENLKEKYNYQIVYNSKENQNNSDSVLQSLIGNSD